MKRKKSRSAFRNPFRPGAGHPPPHLAGRRQEREEFLRLLDQDRILENLILTGLRGIGKTVFLDVLRPMALDRDWLWAGGEFSEAASHSESQLSKRIVTDLSVLTAQFALPPEIRSASGVSENALTFDALEGIVADTPGLAVDKLKGVLRKAWTVVSQATEARGLIFAYDEAQTLGDYADRGEYPRALLLDAFQSLQRQGLPLMLVLAGLPNLFRKLVESRTYAERMFRVRVMDRLSPQESEEAVRKPIEDDDCPLRLADASVRQIVERSGGYPYFLQFMCKEVYDAFIQRVDTGRPPSVPFSEIERKLDSDFFAGRWARCTERQRDLLAAIAALDEADGEFAVRDIQAVSPRSPKRPFSASHIVQMLGALERQGLVFKNRRARYAFAVPLLGQFIRREYAEPQESEI